MCKYCQVYESVARYDYYCHPTPGVSRAAGRRVEGGGRGQEAAARQCAYGRPLERRAWLVAGRA